MGQQDLGFGQRSGRDTDASAAKARIDVLVDDVDLKKAVDLLYRVETAPQAIRIRDMRLKTNRKDRTQLDLRMELAFLKPGGES